MFDRKSFSAGVLLILSGLITPSMFLIECFRKLPQDPVLAGRLLTGALLFRVGLVTLGTVLIALSAQNIRKRLGWQSTAQATTDPRDTYRIPLWLLLIVSTGLRLYKLGEGLWLDEIAMYVKYLTLPFGALLTTYDSENQHLLFTILARLFTYLPIENTWAMRLPAVLFGVASIWALYVLGKELSTRREAFLSASLLSLSYYHIWFSQNARGYTGLLFWTLFTSWFFVRALSGSQTRLWIYYACTVALGIFTQFIMIFIAAGHFLIYLYFAFIRPQPAIRWTGLLLGFALAGLLAFQLYALVLPQFLNTIGMKGTVAIWNNPLWTLRELIRGMKVSFMGSFAALAALLVFFAGLWSYARSKPLLIWLLILPPVLGSIVIIALGHPLWPRFFFFTFGFGALIVVRGGMTIGKLAAKRLPMSPSRAARADKAGLLFCCCLILVSAFSIPVAYLPKQDFVGAQHFVEENRRPGDAVVTVGRVVYPYSKFYRTNFTEVTSIETLNEVRRNSERTWLLYMIPEDVQAVYPEIMASIQNNFKTVKKFPSPLADGTIFVCVTK